MRSILRLRSFSIVIAVLIALASLTFLVPDEARQKAKANGTFVIDGTRIIDPQGNDFEIVGTNINGPNWYWPRDMAQDADLIADVWKFNFVRVISNVHVHSGSYSDNNDTDKLVNAFTSRGVVVMFGAHDWTGTQPTGQDLIDLKNWLAGLANKYKDNPYVWFDTYNEPFGCASSNLTQWLAVQRELISSIRNTGATNIISVEGTQWGTDSGTDAGCFDQNGMVAESKSAILTHGQQLVSQYDNLLFQIHMYCWGTDAKMTNFLDRVAAKNLSIFVGEYGVSGGDNCNSVPSTESLFRVLPPRNIGRVVWHWFGGDGNTLVSHPQGAGGYFIDRTDGTRPTNLTWLGGKVWDDNHSNPPGGDTLFSSGLESGQTQLTWSNTVDSGGQGAGGKYNVGGLCCNLSGPELVKRNEVAHSGSSAILYSGSDLGTNGSYAYMKAFDVSSQNIIIGPDTTLSYWIFPQGPSGGTSGAHYTSGNNSSCVAVDLIFSGGTNLRDSGVATQNGVRAHPAHQCGRLTMNSWNRVAVNLGSTANGKQVLRIDIGYDQPGNTGGYRGYVDDILLSN